MKESEKRIEYQDLARELKKTVEHENDGDTNFNERARRRLVQVLEDLEIRGRVESI